MDISIGQVLELGTKLGITGLILIIWYFDRRDIQKVVEEHRKETSDILAKYAADVKEIRDMYRNNVNLVEGYESIAKDLHNVVVLNIQHLQSMEDSVESNQYCPLLRVEKKKIEVGK